MKIIQGNEYGIVQTTQKITLNKMVQTGWTSAAVSLRLFVERCLTNFEDLSKWIHDKRFPFVQEFSALYSTVVVIATATTEYHPKTNGQSECFDSSFTSQLHYYVSDHQTDCNTYLLPLKYDWHALINMYMKKFSSRFALMRNTFRSATVIPKCVSIGSDNDTIPPALRDMK